MKSEPCVRFGMRISPKMSENPADSRNSRPPKVTLLTVITSQKFMAAASLRSLCSVLQAPPVATPARWKLLRLDRREIARIDRLGEEFLFVVSPELADV